MSTDSAQAGIAAATLEWATRAVMQGLQLAFAYYVADKQFELAQEYSDRAQAIHDEQMRLLTSDVNRWENTIAPCFDALIAEACSAPIAVADYHGAASRALTTVRYQAALAKQKALECATVHCVGVTCHTVNNLAFKEAALATGAIQHAMRREDIDVDRKNAIRRDFKAQVIAMGRNAYDASNRSASALAAQYNAMASEAGKGLSGSLQALGYGANALGNTLINNPWRGTAQTNNPFAPVGQDEKNAIVQSFAGSGYSGYTDATGAVGKSSTSDWGADPLAGAKGATGAEATSAGAATEPAYWGGEARFGRDS